ncbi:epidermal growth factor receptor kinase substrate 8-like protein 1a [Poeciliopsis prolifica]|uniref:epidermal growth factor receptor kinase substrate 8-like protein 1a n=1 Tax=Poeciliopsis prolifica TaxID=188132 RepID=UPI0024133A66|nr:epidermal growth factor receptor kinase substrate 8-like protein 1a [Poeciliopsis prolifica]
MSTSPPQVIPRKPSGVKVLTPLRELHGPNGLPIITDPKRENGTSGKSSHKKLMTAEREVEILNHCFDDIERFMARLQQTAEARSILNQRTKRSAKKSTKNDKQDLLTKKATPPSEQEFVDIFQKIKYSFCLLDRLKSSISQPDAPDLLHHIFLPLNLMVKTTEGPTLAASVKSPCMTRGAVSLLQEHLTGEEKELWKLLGPNWTSDALQQTVSVPPYSPVFLDGWQPQTHDSAGQLLVDPIQLQHEEDAFNESIQKQSQQEHVQPAPKNYREGTEKGDKNEIPSNGERLYHCNYDFVARNNDELSVLHGETLEVLELSSDRFWKCRNSYDEIGLVPCNNLEPLSALNNRQKIHPVLRTESKKTALTPRCFSYVSSRTDGFSPTATSRAERAHSMILPSNMTREDGNRVRVMNNELLQRLAKKRNSLEEMEVSSTAGISIPLNYHSASAEVKAWLSAKGFSQGTVETLGVLNGAQLFSLKNEELCRVCPLEGERIYLQVLGQKSLLEDVRKVSELETVVEK